VGVRSAGEAPPILPEKNDRRGGNTQAGGGNPSHALESCSQSSVKPMGALGAGSELRADGPRPRRGLVSMGWHVSDDGLPPCP